MMTKNSDATMHDTQCIQSAQNKGMVLVVDDEPRVSQFIAHILKEQNYLVDNAASGAMALEKLQQSPYDLVITDLKMPKMDGLALARRCRGFRPETDVIILTAYGTIPSAVTTIKRGVQDYLNKPFQKAELIQTFDSMTLDRPYRAAIPCNEIIASLRASAGSQLDPRLVDEWCNLWQVGAHGVRPPALRVKGQTVPCTSVS